MQNKMTIESKLTQPCKGEKQKKQKLWTEIWFINYILQKYWAMSWCSAQTAVNLFHKVLPKQFEAHTTPMTIN